MQSHLPDNSFGSAATSPASLSQISPRTLFQSLKGRLWGYDFFISYHWASGGQYAVNLAQRLRDRHYDVFLDRAEFASGDNWEAVGKRALHNTQRLVLIATREAVTISKPVEVEVTHFTRRNRQVISIVFQDKFAALDRSQYPTLSCMADSQLYIEDTKESLTTAPSEETVIELVRTYGVMRRRDLRAMLTLIPAVLIIAFAAFATVSWGRAIVSANEARKSAVAENAAKNAALISAQQARESAESERVAKDAAIESRDHAQNELAHAQFNMGRAQFEQGNTDNALLWWGKSCITASDLKWKSTVRSLIGGWAPQVSVVPQASNVFSISQDGQMVVAASSDDCARIWDVRTRMPVGQPLRHQGPISAVVFSPDNETVLTGSTDSTARLWRSRVGIPLCEPMPHSGPVSALSFSSDGEKVATACLGSVAQVWNARTGVPCGEAMRHRGPVVAISFAPDSQSIITGSADNTAQIWNANTGLPRGDPLRHEGIVHLVGFSPDGKILLTGSFDKSVRLWEAETGSPVGEPLSHDHHIYAACFSPDGLTVLTGSGDSPTRKGDARLWDVQAHKLKTPILLHDAPVMAVSFSPNGKSAVTGSEDQTVRLWNAEAGTQRGDPLRHDGRVGGVKFSPDGQFVVSGAEDNTLKLWRVQPVTLHGKPMVSSISSTPASFNIYHPIAAFTDRAETVVASARRGPISRWNVSSCELKSEVNLFGIGDRHSVLAINPDAETAVILRFDNKVTQLYDLQTGKPQGQPLEHKAVTCGQFSPNGQKVVTGSWDATSARLWDARSGASFGETMHHEGPVISVSFSHDGQFVLTGTGSNDSRRQDGSARIWDSNTGKPRTDPIPHQRFISAVCLSPNGDTIVTGSVDGIARLWNAHTGESVGFSFVHTGIVKSVEFSSDGQTLLCGTGDPYDPLKNKAAVWMWNVQTGLARSPRMLYDREVTGATFSPDCQMILAASEDGTACLWIVPPAAILDSIHPQRLQLSIETRTGKQLDEHGIIKRLSLQEWLERRNQLEEIGGPCDAPTWEQLRSWISKEKSRT